VVTICWLPIYSFADKFNVSSADILFSEIQVFEHQAFLLMQISCYLHIPVPKLQAFLFSIEMRGKLGKFIHFCG